MNLFNPNLIGKLYDALEEASRDFRAGKFKRIYISPGNIKTGAIPSVSLLPIIFCPNRCKGTCARYCYAAKIANLRPSVLKSWARNTVLFLEDFDSFWDQISAAIAKSEYFRFHVSGDFMRDYYFSDVVNAAKDNPNCQILAFTKAFELVNNYIDANGPLPENLHILFSGEENLKPINPHNLPETTIYNTGEEIRPGWLLCGGNCFNCVCRGLGCWRAKNGDVIAFKKH